MIIKLDKKDKEILYQLDIDSRQTDSEIAKKVRLSRSAVSYRINNLIKNGIIRNFITLVNPAKVNKNVYKIYLKLFDTSKEKESLIKEYLIRDPHVIWVIKCEGRWDIIAAVWMKEPFDFNEFMDKFSGTFNTIILEKQYTTQIEVPFLSRSYLSSKQGEIKFIWGGKKSLEGYDDKDIEILKILSTNSRMNVVEIAKHTNLTPRIVSYRVQQLLKKGIIIGFTLSIDVNTFGYDYYKTILYIKDFDLLKRKALLEYCKLLKHSKEFIISIGPWELEIEWEVKDYKHLIFLINKIRERFGQDIKLYESLLIVEEYKGEYNLLQ